MPNLINCCSLIVAAGSTVCTAVIFDAYRKTAQICGELPLDYLAHSGLALYGFSVSQNSFSVLQSELTDLLDRCESLPELRTNFYIAAGFTILATTFLAYRALSCYKETEEPPIHRIWYANLLYSNRSIRT
ncbi:MAG: hypothetical protein K1000chlam2_01551 [Chlamydiae bacterium]|nr:hypothetical protein [Chlamydiota bacterium]